MKERHKAVPASYLIFRREEKILLSLRQNTGYYDGWYTLPSGHVEEGELPIGAAIRESKEEVGLELQPGQVRHVHTMYRTRGDGTGDRADYFFEAIRWAGEPINQEPEKCVALEWFSLQALPTNIIPYVGEVLMSIAAGVWYSEVGLDQNTLNPSI